MSPGETNQCCYSPWGQPSSYCCLTCGRLTTLGNSGFSKTVSFLLKQEMCLCHTELPSNGPALPQVWVTLLYGNSSNERLNDCFLGMAWIFPKESWWVLAQVGGTMVSWRWGNKNVSATKFQGVSWRRLDVSQKWGVISYCVFLALMDSAFRCVMAVVIATEMKAAERSRKNIHHEWTWCNHQTGEAWGWAALAS